MNISATRAACFACGAPQLRVITTAAAAASPVQSTWRARRSQVASSRSRATQAPTRVRDDGASTCVVLWFGEGSLRLSDCGAVAAAACFRNALVVPVAVLTVEESMRCARATNALADALRKMGSRLVVRFVHCASEKIGVVEQIAGRVRARHIFASIALSTLGATAPGMRFFPVALIEAPVAMPGLPAEARLLRSDTIGVDMAPVIADGEARARMRLQVATQAGRGGVALVRIFAKEIAAGSLARCRVMAGCGARKSGRVLCASASAVGAVGLMNAYDVLDNDRRGVEWDEKTQKFKLKQWEHTAVERTMTLSERWAEFMRRRRRFLFDAFFPPDVTPDYYAFTAWRFSQRCMSATVGVFGTQALLLALGVRAGRIGQAAAISWVLKDGLGRVGKMIWASGMGKDFDVDPKRWRFRSALLYALGNGLEIVTQLFPASFLLFATAANSMKQVSMLTSSACRNAMYRSFAGDAQNIANITAKGEAQIVIADLIGMVCGIRLSKLIGTSKRSVLAAYTILTFLDIFGIYMELRQVVFRTLNPERSTLIIQHYLNNGLVLTPALVSPHERIFRRPRYRRRTRFSSIAKAARSPEELDTLLTVFRREHFLVSMPSKNGNGPCRVVLRKDASNDDVMRAMLTAAHAIKAVKLNNGKGLSRDDEENILRQSRKLATKHYPAFKRALRDAGWNTDNLLFGTLKRRGYWRRESS